VEVVVEEVEVEAVVLLFRQLFKRKSNSMITVELLAVVGVELEVDHVTMIVQEQQTQLKKHVSSRTKSKSLDPPPPVHETRDFNEERCRLLHRNNYISNSRDPNRGPLPPPRIKRIKIRWHLWRQHSSGVATVKTGHFLHLVTEGVTKILQT
jgi:hypothetical protein